MHISGEFVPFIIKEYRRWTLLLHKTQYPYVGRCMAWWNDCKPGEGEGMTPLDIAGSATNELFREVFADVMRGCKALGYDTAKYGSEFLINTCYLANGEEHNHHMHWHFIPRHKHRLINSALGIEIEDLKWGHNYVPHPMQSANLNHETVLKIQDIMAEAVGGLVDVKF